MEQLCEKHQISPATFYKWKNELDDMQQEEKRRLRELEQENLRLKKMYAELQLRHEVMSEALVWCFEQVFIKTAPSRFRLNVIGAIHAISKELTAMYNTTYITENTVVQLLEESALRYNIHQI